jgi:hypothetical protein
MLQRSSDGDPIYRAFGINLQCALPSAADFGLPEASGSVIPDAVMRCGKVPETLDNSVRADPVITAAPGSVLVDIKNVARYLIRNGDEIIIEPFSGAKDGDIATYAFGTAVGTLLYQRGVFVLHGSAVATPNGAVIFTGMKGAGKSTTASALAVRDHPFLSDDICAIHISASGKPVLYPGLTRSKIALDSYQEILRRAPDAPPVSPVLNKYAASFPGSREPHPLYAICVLEETADTPQIKKISGAERLTLLIENIYRPLIYELTDLPRERFVQCANVASNVLLYRVCRPKSFSDMNVFIRLLENTVLSA